MAVPKLFIASSTPAKPLVNLLIKALDSSKVETVLWYDCFEPGDHPLDTLIGRSEECDYLAVLLTKDDRTQKKGKRLLVPRDNCIFELGLFLGALGRDPKRCFMVTSLEQNEALPSDLEGRTYVKIDDEGPQRDLSIRKAADTITKQVVRYGCLSRGRELPFLTGKQLIAIEQPSAKGGELVIEQGLTVVVNSAQPIERDYEVATIVLENMKAGVKYEYYFEGDRRNTEFISNLVQTLAIAGLKKSASTSPEEMLDVTRKKSVLVAKNLETLRKNLSIHFRERPPLQFCVHNANSEDYAVCYLSYRGTGFVRWFKHREAVEVADELQRSCTAIDKDGQIFHSTVDFPLEKHETLIRELTESIKLRFDPSLQNRVKAACFGSKGL